MKTQKPDAKLPVERILAIQIDYCIHTIKLHRDQANTSIM